MKEITPDNQSQHLSEKDRVIRTHNYKPPDNSAFHHTLRVTIKHVDEISKRANAALHSLSTTNQDEFEAVIDQACSFHQRMMEVQRNLATLYQKMKTAKK